MTRQHRYLDGPWHDVQEKCPDAPYTGCLLPSGFERIDSFNQYHYKPEEACPTCGGPPGLFPGSVIGLSNCVANLKELIASLTERMEKLEDNQWSKPAIISSLLLRVKALEDPNFSISQPPAPPQEGLWNAAIDAVLATIEEEGTYGDCRTGCKEMYSEEIAKLREAGPPQEKITLHRETAGDAWSECLRVHLLRAKVERVERLIAQYWINKYLDETPGKVILRDFERALRGGEQKEKQ